MKFGAPFVKPALIVFAIVILAAGAWLGYQLNNRPSLAPYARLALPAATGPGLRVTFFGVATLLFDDGETALLTAGFFTRPDASHLLFKPLQTDRQRAQDDAYRNAYWTRSCKRPAHGA
jgi:hypothetical protein